jgi:hypothetical protein
VTIHGYARVSTTGNSGQTVAPSSTTAIDGRANLKIGGAAGAYTPYRVCTVALAGAFLLPFANLHTGALTVDNVGSVFVDIGGALIIPPGAWCSRIGFVRSWSGRATRIAMS